MNFDKLNSQWVIKTDVREYVIFAPTVEGAKYLYMFCESEDDATHFDSLDDARHYQSLLIGSDRDNSWVTRAEALEE